MKIFLNRIARNQIPYGAEAKLPSLDPLQSFTYDLAGSFDNVFGGPTKSTLFIPVINGVAPNVVADVVFTIIARRAIVRAWATRNDLHPISIGIIYSLFFGVLGAYIFNVCAQNTLLPNLLTPVSEFALIAAVLGSFGFVVTKYETAKSLRRKLLYIVDHFPGASDFIAAESLRLCSGESKITIGFEEMHSEQEQEIQSHIARRKEQEGPS